MNRKRLEYEPPKTKIYRFDDNDRILTESGGENTDPTPTPEPTPDFAANALNEFFGGTNTTIEK